MATPQVPGSYMNAEPETSPIASAAREAAGDTVRLFVIPLAAVLSLVVAVVLLVAGQPPGTAAACGVLTLLAIVLAFFVFFNSKLRGRLAVALGRKDTLLNERKDWERRVTEAEAKAKDRDSLAESNQSLAERVKVAEERLSGLERERTELTGNLATVTRERDGLQHRTAALDAEKAMAEQDLLRAQADNARLAAALDTERLSTARADRLPLIRPSIEIVPAGWFKPKNVQVTVENIGKGNATEVQVTGGPGSGVAPVPTTSINYYPSMKPGEKLSTVIGTADDFQDVEWVGANVAYSGPFGPVPSTGIRRSLR